MSYINNNGNVAGLKTVTVRLEIVLGLCPFFPKTVSRHCVSHECFHVN